MTPPTARTARPNNAMTGTSPDQADMANAAAVTAALAAAQTPADVRSALAAAGALGAELARREQLHPLMVVVQGECKAFETHGAALAGDQAAAALLDGTRTRCAGMVEYAKAPHDDPARAAQLLIWAARKLLALSTLPGHLAPPEAALRSALVSSASVDAAVRMAGTDNARSCLDRFLGAAPALLLRCGDSRAVAGRAAEALFGGDDADSLGHLLLASTLAAAPGLWADHTAPAVVVGSLCRRAEACEAALAAAPPDAAGEHPLVRVVVGLASAVAAAPVAAAPGLPLPDAARAAQHALLAQATRPGGTVCVDIARLAYARYLAEACDAEAQAKAVAVLHAAAGRPHATEAGAAALAGLLAVVAGEVGPAAAARGLGRVRGAVAG